MRQDIRKNMQDAKDPFNGDDGVAEVDKMLGMKNTELVVRRAQWAS